jgi:hypothetical protein
MSLSLDRIVAAVATAAVLALGACSTRADVAVDQAWQQEFDLSSCDPTSTGRNEFFVLEPEFRLVLEGNNERLAITVLDETKTITGITTRIVEEREWRNDVLIEVSSNFSRSVRRRTMSSTSVRRSTTTGW